MNLAAVIVWLAALFLCSPSRAEEGPRYFPIEVFVETAGRLGAYQLEIQVTGAEIVGVEGGDHAAFEAPPYYDPAALRGNRIKLAALGTAGDLPSGRIRVSTLHIREVGGAPLEWTVSSSLATDSEARTIDARVELVPSRQETDR